MGAVNRRCPRALHFKHERKSALALHEPKTAAALFARVLPYFINVGMEVPEVVSEAEMEAMLKELGLMRRRRM